MTSKEFAKKIGVSQSTVSRALNNSSLVTDETKKEILEKAREFGFVLNSQARGLKTNRTDTIGILFPKHFKSMTSNLMLAHVYDLVQAELNKYGYDVMTVYYSKTDTNDISNLERIIRTRKVDGFLIMRMELSPNEADLINHWKFPCVFLMNAGSHINDQFNYIFSDSEFGGLLAGRYLGSFKEAFNFFITINEEKSDALRRRVGYEKGLMETGNELSGENIFRCHLSIESAYNCIMENIDKFKDRKVNLYTYSDTIAIGAVQALKDCKISIPDQVQVIGTDDMPLTTELSPKLSTIHVNAEGMVTASCELLMDLINGNFNDQVHVWMKPSLVLRETTR